MELITVHSVDDIVYFVEDSNNYTLKKGKIISIIYDTKNIITYKMQIFNFDGDHLIDDYSYRTEEQIFKNMEDAQLLRISLILNKYRINLEDVVKLLPNISSWKEQFKKEETKNV